MRFSIILLLSVLFSTPVDSQDQFLCWDWGVNSIAMQQTYWDDGNLKTENIATKSGLVRVSYFAGGGVWIKEEIWQGRTVDTIITFDPETYVETIRVVKNFCDFPNGIHLEYYPSGEIKTKGRYKWNRLVGEWIQYFQNGNIWKVLNYGEEEIIDGVYLEYHENGVIKVEGLYAIGITQQKVIAYDPETFEKQIRMDERKESVKSGIWKFYSEKGQLLEEINYNN